MEGLNGDSRGVSRAADGGLFDQRVLRRFQVVVAFFGPRETCIHGIWQGRGAGFLACDGG